MLNGGVYNLTVMSCVGLFVPDICAAQAHAPVVRGNFAHVPATAHMQLPFERPLCSTNCPNFSLSYIFF